MTSAPLRRVRLLRAGGALVVAAVAVTMFVIAPGPVAGITQAVVVAAICGYGFLQFWLALQTAPDATVHRESVDAGSLPPAERRRYFRRHAIGAAIAFSVLSAWIAYDLAQAESGAAAASVWWPVAVVYDYAGFWPAVLSMPVLGTLVVVALTVKLRQVDDGS
jgi:hypothetical protein